MLDVGTVIGGYRVVSHLATGGMGEIYKVVHVDRGTTHALKYLPLANSRIRKRLQREADLQTKLSHPNVVTLTEVIDVNGDPGLVMEFVDGPSLARWLRDHKPTLEESERLFRGVVSGVGHAHRKGMVHRDLKPSNILLARTPEGIAPKVADFGIAKALSDEGQEKLTRTGHSLGSPAYMAPEQITNAHGVDQRADIFALGCLLYELVCGERAFKGDDTLEVLNAVSHGHYTPPEQVKADLPKRFTVTIKRCMARDARERFPNCEDLVDSLGGDTLVDEDGPKGRPAGIEQDTEPRERPWSMEKTRPMSVPPMPRAAVEGVAGIVLTVIVLAAALLLGVLGAWAILG